MYFLFSKRPLSVLAVRWVWGVGWSIDELVIQLDAFIPGMRQLCWP